MKPSIFGPLAWPTTLADDPAPRQLRRGGRDDVAPSTSRTGSNIDLLASSAPSELDLEPLADLDHVLLPAGADDCVHRRERRTLPESSDQPVRQGRWPGSEQGLVEEMPRPLQIGQVSENDSTRPSRDPLAGHLHQAQLRDLEHLGAGLVAGQGVAEAAAHLVAVRLDLHVDEVDDDDPADVAQAQLAGDLLGRLEVVAETVSSRFDLPTYLPVLTSITVIASVRSMMSEPPEGSHTLRSSALSSCSWTW